jgi:FkbM family methyltransferase
MEGVKKILFDHWNNKSMSTRIGPDKVEYFWPHIDRFSFDHQINTYKPVIDEVTKNCKNFRTVLQAGGNCGIYTNEYSKRFKNVYTFEPDMTNMMCLTLNCINSSNIVKFQACLGDEHSLTSIQNPLELMDIGGIHVKSHNEPPKEHLTVESEKRIPILKIDDLSLEDLDLIHLDIEGYELYALKGGVETIKKFKPTIVLELVDEHLGRFNCTREDVMKFMESIDYKFIKQLDSNNDCLFQPNSV